jgi:SAM-dependent methyltransferase
VGRRSVRLEDQDRWVFNRLAADYLARPPYPEPLVARLIQLAGGAGGRAADLGAGVGHLALPLAAAGLSVAAVEPAQAMLAALAERGAHLTERAAARFAERPQGPPARPGSGLAPVHAAAEATGLPAAAFDLVLLADAVQWVDPEQTGAEVRRLLAPGGAAAIVEGAFAAEPFMDRLAALLARRNPKARLRPAGAGRQILALAAPGAAPAVERFRQEALLDGDALAAVLRSLSYAGPALGAEGVAALVAEAQAAAAELGGARFCRDLTLSWVQAGRRRPPRGS